MKFRVFVAILLPVNISDDVEVWQMKHPDFAVRWIEPQNLHITLVPPWYADEENLQRIDNVIQDAASQIQPFEAHFKKILWGPGGNMARLIWAEGDTPEKFKSLKHLIEEKLLGDSNTEFLKKGNRPAKLHLTLARFQPTPLKKLPPLDEAADWKFEMQKVHLMGSVLKREGAKYRSLHSCSLQGAKKT